MGIDITGAGAIADLVGNVINKIWPDKTEQEKQQLAMAVQVVNGQLAINQEEARNPSLFVSGARPFIIWMCGVSLLYCSFFEQASVCFRLLLRSSPSAIIFAIVSIRINPI